MEKEISTFNPSKEDLVLLLAKRSMQAHQVWARGYETCKQNTAGVIYLRGLAEISNICGKDCYYCGIRKSNEAVERYTMCKEDILLAAAQAHKNNLGSITLQSGEVKSPDFTNFAEEIIKEIKMNFPDLKIVLSFGEQSKDTYKLWKAAGADRYLLKIETTSQRLYSMLHPQNVTHSLEKRKKALAALKETGYQVGSGIMVGLPGQNLSDIANDILFFKEIDMDMAGIGPYIEHSQTPLAGNEEIPPEETRLVLTLNTIAALRIAMPSINIAAATSLDALNKYGKEMAVSAGANVIMINLTPEGHRKNYRLYERGLDELDKNVLAQLESYGEKIAYGAGGDSLHFINRTRLSF
ncbi:biotin synthase [Elusimicrobium posterum]|uniref:[FeFe] hydrogenase H-cluster radical SAM maturase HydE n=1 Tax=Elusimicrobium posterum TaxID=3116653 RepID=UPI003C795E63